MSLISYKYESPTSTIRRHVYSLMDSDFGKVCFDVDNGNVWFGIAMVYTNRNLSVGKNIALAMIHRSKQIIIPSIHDMISFQDRTLSKSIPNWIECAKERDEYLEKLLPLL